MASPNLSEIVTTTLRNRSKRLADNFTVNTALLQRMNSKGKVKPFSGGRTIVHELSYAKNGTFKRFSGYEQLDISPSDVFSAAEYSIKQAAVAVSISGLEMLQNSGENALIDLLESRIENAEKTMFDELSADLYSDGTADGGKQIGGLQLIISDTGAGTVGGINASTWSFWQNQVQSVGGAITSSNIQTNMNSLYLATMRNRDHTDLIVADNVAYQAYWESLQAIQRIHNTKLAEAGFQNLKFQGADVVADGGLGGSAPASHMYFINTDFLQFRPHSSCNMVPLGPDRYSTNQDSVVKLLGWAGNLTCNNRQLQGVLKV